MFSQRTLSVWVEQEQMLGMLGEHLHRSLNRNFHSFLTGNGANLVPPFLSPSSLPLSKATYPSLTSQDTKSYSGETQNLWFDSSYDSQGSQKDRQRHFWTELLNLQSLYLLQIWVWDQLAVEAVAIEESTYDLQPC